MTTPPPPDTAVPALIQAHDADALALELAAADAATSALRHQLAGILAALRLQWIRQFGPRAGRQSGGVVRQVMADLAIQLRQVHIDPRPTLLGYASKAQALGVWQGFREAGVAPVPLDSTLPTGTLDAIADSVEAAHAKLATAADVVSTLEKGSLGTLARTIAPAQSAVSLLERDARTVTNERLNGGIRLVAEHLDGQLLWVAERDACLVCAALSGEVVDAGDEFDIHASFGREMAWVPPGGLAEPPRHPRCRCRVTPWFGGEADVPSPRSSPESPGSYAVHRVARELPSVLRREAERSVLHGWALPSESDGARRQAADRLLTKVSSRGGIAPSGWHVPKSVRTQAQRRLKSGEFGATPFPGKSH